MPLELHHIGEELTVKLLESLHETGRLRHVSCADCKKTLAAIIKSTVGHVVAVTPQARPHVTLSDGTSPRIDGMHKIDAVVVGDECALPFEAKLGTTALAWSRVSGAIGAGCELRIEGSGRALDGKMWCLLARTGAAKGATVCLAHPRGVIVGAQWVLVARRVVQRKWRRLDSVFKHSHVIVFEDLVRALRSPSDDFDRIVAMTVAAPESGYRQSWGLH